MKKRMSKKALETLQILEVNIAITPEDKLLEKIDFSLKKNVQLCVFTPNPEILVKAKKDSDYKDILNFADVNIPDGVGISFAAKFLYGKKLKRIRGREFFLRLLDYADKNGSRVFFAGASEEVNLKAVKKASKVYSRAKFEGTSDIKNSLEKINKFNPHMLFVALGAPKQEKFIYENFKNLDARVMMAVGGSLDFFVGKQHIAPTWISRGGLEWLWRLCFDPGRIKRIFNAVVVFPALVIVSRFTQNDN